MGNHLVKIKARLNAGYVHKYVVLAELVGKTVKQAGQRDLHCLRVDS